MLNLVMKKIILIVLIIAIPIYGIYGTISGAVNNNMGELMSGIICLAITIFFFVTIIYSIKHPKDTQKTKQSLTPEEQRQRNIAFVRKHAKAFLAWSIVSAVFAVASLVLLIIFAQYSDIALIALTLSMFSFVLFFVGLFASWLGVKLKSKKNMATDKTVGKTIDVEENDSNINLGNQPYWENWGNNDTDLEKAETAATKTMTEEEKCNTEEWLKYKAKQDRLARERVELAKQRQEQEKREREKKSIEYLNKHKYTLVEKYSEAVFNFIEKLTETYPNIFLRMFNNMETLQSSILVKPYENASQLLKTKILNDGLEFTESDNAEANKKIQELTNFFIQGLKKRIVESGDYNDEFTFSALLYCIVRNNVIKYYRNEYIETYGYESLDELCDHIANPFEQDKTNIKVLDDVLTISRFMSNNAISQFVYYYIYENNFELPFVDTYKKIVLDMKQIFERKKKEKLENDLFGKPKKKTVTENETPHTLSAIDRIDRMSGEQFEIFMEDYFRKQGFKVERTPLSGDYGIDLIIENDFSKIGVQAKCYSNKVTASAVQEVVTGLRHYGLSGGMVVTNNYFQPAAIQLAKDNGITLWNRDKLIEKLKK